ncbi:MAG: hypothetical protein WAW07_06895 [Bacteroidales bacterium]
MVILLSAFTKTGWTQPITTGPLFPTTVTDDSGIGSIEWANPSNARTDNNIYSQASISIPRGVTHYLKATNFGFNIPESATILGIQATIGRYGQSSNIIDYSVRLLKNGTVAGTDLVSTNLWPSPEAAASYGGTSNLWGTTWSPSEINASNFGVALSAQNTKVSPRTAYVDYFSITVTYNCPIPAQPGNITGPASVCPNTSGLTYSISPVSGASSYTWSAPSGWSITAGQGSTGITVNSGNASGNISVVANNACGSGPARTLAVVVYTAFSAGSISSTGETICSPSNDPSEISNSVAASGGDGNITYQWQYSADAAWTSPQTIPESNSVTYDPPAGLTETRWYRRQAHDGSCNPEFESSTGVWQVIVAPEFSAGEIASTGEVISFNGDPGIIGSTTPASGGDGIITYQWQYSTDEAWTSPQTITESNSATYDPPAGLTETRWYRRQAHDGLCNTEFVPSSGIWLVSVSISNTWIGAIDDDWNNISNWSTNNIPTAESDVTIPAEPSIQPTISTEPMAECNNLTIEADASLEIYPAQALTVHGTFSNSGIIALYSGANGTASIIVDTYNRETGGEEYIEIYLTGGNWHYISSPVTSLSVSDFGTQDLAAYYECRISSNQDNGWIAYDGYRYNDETISDTTFSVLSVGQGYDYYNLTTSSPYFSGILNTSGPTISLTYNSKGTTPDYPGAQGFNLLGNPFPSCLDWDQIASTLDPSISKAIYFTYNGNFASYVNGVGTNNGTATIPPMQGFFVKTYAQGTSVALNEEARVHNTSQIRYKGDSEIIPLIRLKIENQLRSDESVVRFDDKATDQVDNLFDAYKFSQTGNGVGIWTVTENVNYSINGLPFPETKAEIAVGIYNAGAESSKITGAEIIGLDDYNVILTDKLTNTSVDLKKAGSYSFQAQGGIVSDRFVVTVSNVSTGVPEIPAIEKSFNVYSAHGNIYIQSLSETWDLQTCTVNIYDLYGRRILQKSNLSWSKGEIKEINLSGTNGIYLVEIKSKSLKFIGKIKFNK